MAWCRSRSAVMISSRLTSVMALSSRFFITSACLGSQTLACCRLKLAQHISTSFAVCLQVSALYLQQYHGHMHCVLTIPCLLSHSQSCPSMPCGPPSGRLSFSLAALQSGSGRNSLGTNKQRLLTSQRSPCGGQLRGREHALPSRVPAPAASPPAASATHRPPGTAAPQHCRGWECQGVVYSMLTRRSSCKRAEVTFTCSGATTKITNDSLQGDTPLIWLDMVHLSPVAVCQSALEDELQVLAEAQADRTWLWRGCP